MRKWVQWVGMMVLIVTLAGCGQHQAKQKEKQANIQAADIIITMDPALVTDEISGQALSNVYSGLYRFIGNKLTPDMAEKRATVSPDQLTYTFHLRKNAKWSDGHPVVAQDFVYAWRRAADPATGAQYAYVFTVLANGEKVVNGQLAPDKLGVCAKDAHTLVVTLDHPTPYFERLVTLQSFLPLEARRIKKANGQYGDASRHMTFNGPYRLSKWRSGDQSWTQVKNLKYWNHKQVKIDRLHYQVVRKRAEALALYKSGKLDDIVLGAKEAKAMRHNPAYNIVPENRTYYFEMNAERVPAFKQVAVRQALSTAVSQKAFIKDVLKDGSQPIKTVVPTKMIESDDGEDFTTAPTKAVGKAVSYDVEKARQLFAEGMAAAGQDHLTITLTVDDATIRYESLPYLKRMFERVSSPKARLTVNVQRVSYSDRIRLTSERQNDMVLTGWSADYPDAATVLELFVTDGIYNGGQWSNAEYDALVHRGKTVDALNFDARRRDFQQASVILTAQAGVIPLFQRGNIHLTRPTLKGMNICSNSLMNFIGASME